MSNIVLATFLGLVLYLATPTSATLAEEEQKELIRGHNLYRSKVQPTATDMVELVREWGRRGCWNHMLRRGAGGGRMFILFVSFCSFLAGMGHRVGNLGPVLGCGLLA